MLTSRDAMLITPLHVLCCNPTITAETIQMLKDICPESALMRNVLDKTPLMMYFKCQKKEYNVYNVNGQLLLLVQLFELGIEYNIMNVFWIFYDGVKLISDLEMGDEVSVLLLPFMYGASLPDCGLDVV
jgi:hypothetical protein